jgi:Skp family chaperone for outer membrane proteins
MRTRTRSGWAVGLCAMALAAGLCGCQLSKSGSKLTVGKVDTAELLHDNPDYQNLSIEYMKENTDLKSKFVDKMKKAGDDQMARNEVQKAYQGEQQKLDKKWMDITQKFLESTHVNIRETAQQIAQSKEIDIVIIDSRVYPTTEWGGVDITKDLSLALTQSAGSPRPAASASPAKKES